MATLWIDRGFRMPAATPQRWRWAARRWPPRSDTASTPAVLPAAGQGDLPDQAGDYVLDSLTLAVTAVLDPRRPADVLPDIVAVGGDTDTNAAIAGGLLGARGGATSLPARWLDVLQFADEFHAAANRLNTTTV